MFRPLQWALLLLILGAGYIDAAPASKSLKSPCSQKLTGKLPSYTPPDFKFSGNIRRYYVAAEETVWDYVPSGYDNMRGVPLALSNAGKVYVGTSDKLGTKYVKGLFKGYTDETYTKKTTQPEWIGLQGPVMRAEEGDMIEILLYNKFTDDDISMHAMGLFYNKGSEGSDYFNTTNSKGVALFSEGQAIPPGECFAYQWLVPRSSSPLPSQPSTLWTYHGDINLKHDVVTGLIGPVIVYHTGQMKKTMSEYRDFILFYASTPEAESVFFDKTVKRFLPSKSKPDPGPDPYPSSKKNQSIWEPIFNDEPNRALDNAIAQQPLHINGYMYNNLPGLKACQSDKISWHLYTFGRFGDGYHIFHPHGNNVQTPSGRFIAQVSLLPASMTTVSMTAYNPGIWNVLCHNGDHFQQGMEAVYNIYKQGECPAQVSQQMNVET